MKLRDDPIEITKDGKRVFARNEKGVAICYATIPNGGGRRCQSHFTMPNGRCKRHGGKAPAGVLHWNAQHLRTADNLPRHLQGDMRRALEDPDPLNLKHEIAMNDLHIAKLKEALDSGLDDSAWKKLKSLADKLEYSLDNDPEESEAICKQVIETIRFGSGERTVWREYHGVEESRRKLVATAHIREKDLKTLLKADQAIALVTGVASACREMIARTFLAIEKRYIIKDRQTGNIVSRIDPAIKADFLGQIGIALGKLIGQTRPDESSVVNNAVNDPGTALAVVKKQVKAKQAKGQTIDEDFIDLDLAGV